jgi:hypothetical protein
MSILNEFHLEFWLNCTGNRGGSDQEDLKCCTAMNLLRSWIGAGMQFQETPKSFRLIVATLNILCDVLDILLVIFSVSISIGIR